VVLFKFTDSFNDHLCYLGLHIFNAIIFIFKYNIFIYSENVNNEIVLTQDISENLIVLLNSEKEINATRIDNKEKINVNFENINDMNRER